MFPISVLESAVSWALMALVILIPLIVARGYTDLSRRLNTIEGQLPKKK